MIKFDKFNLNILDEKIVELNNLTTDTERISLIVKYAEEVNVILHKYNDFFNSIVLFHEMLHEKLNGYQLQLISQDEMLGLHEEHLNDHGQALAIHNQMAESDMHADDQYKDFLNEILENLGKSIDAHEQHLDLHDQQLEILSRHMR